MNQHVWVIGAGAIGSVLAGLLTRAGADAAGASGANSSDLASGAAAARGPAGPRVTLVGSRAHWQAVRRAGLLMEDGLPAGTRIPLATASPDEVPELGESDVVLLAGKLPRLEETAGWLRERLDPGTGLVAVQNGLDIDDLVEVLLGRVPERILVYFGAHLAEPGRVRFFPGRILLRPGPLAEDLGRRLESALTVETTNDFRTAEWQKLAINCLANPLAALLRVRNAGLADPCLDPVKEAILAEARAVAAAENIEVALRADDFNEYMQGPTGGNTPSMAIDLERGDRTEIEWINGAVVQLGRQRGIPTPVNASIVSMVGYLSACRGDCM